MRSDSDLNSLKHSEVVKISIAEAAGCRLSETASI